MILEKLSIFSQNFKKMLTDKNLQNEIINGKQYCVNFMNFQVMILKHYCKTLLQDINGDSDE